MTRLPLFTLALLVLLAGGAGSAGRSTRAAAFPSYPPTLGPPAGWTGPVFQLSQDYPKTLPRSQPHPWLAHDFRTQAREYLMSVRDHAYEGNIGRGADANGNSLDWIVQSNPVRRWYHVPWRHVGSHGREFVHGLTMEFPSRPGTLDPNQRLVHDTWAVAMYNPVAAYTVGKVWPRPSAGPALTKASFAEGSVIAKLLFTTADASDVPGVEGAYTWSANIYQDRRCVKLGCPRAIQTVRLIQMDVAIKDSRAPKTAWVFGTFVYDKAAAGDSVWQKLVPLGLMWGNDPDLSSASADGRPQESVILEVGTHQHLGCHGRLSGPLDNPASACMSCHMAAQYPGANPVPSTRRAKCDDPVNARYWRNMTGKEIFAPPADGGAAYAFDYSMEMASSVQNYMLSQRAATFAPDGETFTLKGRSAIHHVVVRDQ